MIWREWGEIESCEIGYYLWKPIGSPDLAMEIVRVDEDKRYGMMVNHASVIGCKPIHLAQGQFKGPFTPCMINDLFKAIFSFPRSENP
jgi:hypothetical protein